MAKSKVPLILRTVMTSTTAEQTAGEQKTIDLSAYVDALSGKVLRINSVWFSIDNASAMPVQSSFYEGSDVSGTIELSTGTQTTLMGPQDDRIIQSSQYFYQATNITGTMAPPVWFSVLPVPDMGFYVAADVLTFQNQQTTAFDNSVRFCVIIEAERVKLTPADINFLLVNQTLSG